MQMGTGTGSVNPSVFTNSSDASSWFIPYDVEGADMNSQDMMLGSSASNMDPFDSIFGLQGGPAQNNMGQNTSGMAVQNRFQM